MELIRIDAPIAPVPFMRAIPSDHVFNPKRYRQFKEELGWYAKQAMHGQEPLNGLLRLSCHFFKRYRKIGNQGYGDVDNFAKAVMDSLQGICFANDAQIAELHATKHFGEPKIIITLEEMK